jgi:hypothetical protein
VVGKVSSWLNGIASHCPLMMPSNFIDRLMVVKFEGSLWSPCLDRLASQYKETSKQVPVKNGCIKHQSYCRDSVYRSGLGIIFDP